MTYGDKISWYENPIPVFYDNNNVYIYWYLENDK